MEEILVHTGQHYDREMSAVFFKTLHLTVPKYNLGVGSGSHSKQLAKMMEGLEEVLEVERPEIVVVYGDTNSTLAGALVADRLHIPVAHVEAGLRSFNRRMAEECNRVLTDHVSSLLFAPTPTAVENLKREGITQGVFLVGDVMHEAAMQHVDVAEKESTILSCLGLSRKNYSLATVHRAENTDDPERLRSIVKALIEIGDSQIIVWPVHPRARRMLTSADLNGMGSRGIKLIHPVSYLDMLLLEKGANVILTDSGGVQKEAMWFRVPCVTLRDETEWVETVESGWNHIAGSRTEGITDGFRQAMKRAPKPLAIHPQEPPASQLIVERIYSMHSNSARCLAVSS